jgi:hypothetical protein
MWNFLAGIFTANTNRIRNLKFSDFYSNGRMLPRDRVQFGGEPAPVALWLRLQAAGSLAWNTLRHRDATDNIISELDPFMQTYKKGSKKIRNIVSASRK